MITLHILASGSRGNATLVEDTTTGALVALDCGICARAFFDRSAQEGVDLHNLQAIVVTHEHTDHTSGLGVVTRRLAKAGIQPPVYVMPQVARASRPLTELAQSGWDVRDMGVDVALDFAETLVVPFATSHDAAGSCGFQLLSPDGDKVGFMTDTGIVTREAYEALQGCRVLAIEANHDRQMLMEGEYPWALKQRIASDRGHLSNAQSAEALGRLVWPGLEEVVAMHVSEHNNTYRLPVQALEQAVHDHGSAAHVRSAYQGMAITAR